MASPPILQKMLDRLFAALVNGPNLNCRPHSSRQRIDLAQFAKLQSLSPEAILQELLGDARCCTVPAQAKTPKQQKTPVDPEQPETEEQKAEKKIRQAYQEQSAVLSKLRGIADDARTYENDTGVHVLQIGFPLLNLPPGSAGLKSVTRRIIAPLAFVSLAMRVKTGARPAVELACRNEGVDLITPNIALLAWLQQQTGKAPPELFADDDGRKPWHEIASITRAVCEQLGIKKPEELTEPEMLKELLEIKASPRADQDGAQPGIVSAAVIGLYPMANQGLLRDTQAMAADGKLLGPIQQFLEVDPTQEARLEPRSDQPVQSEPRSFQNERLIASADPCQARAVQMSRVSKALVIHGPPGTGKSQTITNIIGDHLARGQRVLFVCDKRTALDVVQNRLESLGLGAFCAIVHDPQRDQRELYKSIREQLENLAEMRTDSSAEAKLYRVDGQLQKLHDDLTKFHAALMKRPDRETPSFHDLVGEWLAMPSGDVAFDNQLMRGVPVSEIDAQSQAIGDLLDRAAQVHYTNNPWSEAAGLSLESFLATQVNDHRESLRTIVGAVTAIANTPKDAAPVFPMGHDCASVGAARADLADRMTKVLADVPLETRKRWVTADVRKIDQTLQKLSESRPQIAAIETGPLDAELAAIVRAEPPKLPTLAQQQAPLDAYLETAGHWYGFLLFAKKKAAGEVLAKYGLTLSQANALKLRSFLQGLKARLVAKLQVENLGQKLPATLPDDDEILSAHREHQNLLDFLKHLRYETILSDVSGSVTDALKKDEQPTKLLAGLKESAAHAERLINCEKAIRVPLLAAKYQDQLVGRLFVSQIPLKEVQLLSDSFDSLEMILRVQHGLRDLGDRLGPGLAALIQKRISGETGVKILRRASLASTISARIESNQALVMHDAPQLASSFQKYTKLDQEKRHLALEAIRHRWGEKQQGRLMASTLSRLSSEGAEVRRRLMLRGERALRLRQVLALGEEIAGGDPLFDLRPVWMASPETVAQIFPRKVMFDVVIFDEASQCRLEESLPVLLRANRVVIAGDPKQLPPTRFFESAVAVSEDDDISTEQDLFERQQGEMEDLLSAALNLSIDEAYLDVHYRSRNSDLIAFSNDNFYNSRLQAIPGHPSNRVRYAPLTLYRADGIYAERTNAIEADRVCAIVRDLLRRAEPPSIGIASFNIAQRDLIVEKLDEMAMQDEKFAAALAEARERQGKGSFEGLFVKNLENVQGDERDHIIISTTYGPDENGKFYRRFGPLGRADGGRRLNVLVTRARDEVHLVTSIPQAVYRSLPPVPPGATPGGAWLLFAYLSFAERLADAYEHRHQEYQNAEERKQVLVQSHPTAFPSLFARKLAERLRNPHGVGSDVHWGNDGFCVDLALHHPKHAEDVTIGIQCDLNRFAQAADPIEWELFRNSVIEAQGWRIHRIWSPHFFRDPEKYERMILKQMEQFLTDEPPRDAFRVERL